MADDVKEQPPLRAEMKQLREDIWNTSGCYVDYDTTRASQKEWVKRLDRLLSLLPKD